jgi:tRNA(fMet)-specific endonuclease VapC
VTWLLDTNACIFVMKLRAPITSRVRELRPDDLAVSVITCAELWFGAAKSQHTQRSRAAQDAFLEPFRIVDFDSKAADRYAALRAHLARAGRQIGDRDLMIAAIALANRMAVVTSNAAEFAHVPGLKVEDWMESG